MTSDPDVELWMLTVHPVRYDVERVSNGSIDLYFLIVTSHHFLVRDIVRQDLRTCLLIFVRYVVEDFIQKRNSALKLSLNLSSRVSSLSKSSIALLNELLF